MAELTAIPIGSEPTWILVMILFVEPDITETLPSPGIGTYIFPFSESKEISDGRLDELTGIVSMTVFVIPDITETVDEP